MKRSIRWDALSTPKKVLVMAATAVQVSLAVSAWTDLAERPAELVNGSKKKWAAVIAVNFVGPILYYRRGRRVTPPAG
jgi:hypothetical protein